MKTKNVKNLAELSLTKVETTKVKGGGIIERRTKREQVKKRG